MQCNRKGKGTPLVFMPGLFAGGWIWDAVIDKCVAHGFSTVVFRDAIPIAFGCDLKQAMTKLDSILAECEEKPFLVGNSLGALIALQYVVENPSLIRGLVMSGAPGMIELDTVPLKKMHTGEIQYARELMDLIFHDKSKIPERGVTEIMRLYGERQTFGNIVSWYSYCRKYDVSGALRKLALPIQFIWGQYDRVTPVEPWMGLAEQSKNIRATVIYECGHSPMVESPERFVEAMLPMLHGHVA